MRVGIAGLGAAGWRVADALITAQRVEPGVTLRLVGGADVKSSARAEFERRYATSTVSTIDELCASPDVETIFVATPNPFHAVHAITAAMYGKNVMVEKPLATTLADSAEVVEVCRRQGVRLMCVHTPVYHPATTTMRRLVESGAFGRALHVSNTIYTPWLLRPRTPSELRTSDGGGVVYRQAPHQVDLARALLGGVRATSVRAVTGRGAMAPNTEGHYSALISFEDGAAATLTYNGYGFFDTAELTWDISLQGGARRPGAGARLHAARTLEQPKTAAAMREAEHIESGGVEASGSEPHPFYGLSIVSCEKADLRQSPDGIRVYERAGVRLEPVAPWHGVLVAELLEMSQVIDAGDGAVLTSDGEWGQETLRICLAILESGRQGRDVTL